MFKAEFTDDRKGNRARDNQRRQLLVDPAKPFGVAGYLQPIDDPKAMERLSAEDHRDIVDRGWRSTHPAPNDDFAVEPERVDQLLRCLSADTIERKLDLRFVSHRRDACGEVGTTDKDDVRTKRL